MSERPGSFANEPRGRDGRGAGDLRVPQGRIIFSAEAFEIKHNPEREPSRVEHAPDLVTIVRVVPRETAWTFGEVAGMSTDQGVRVTLTHNEGETYSDQSVIQVVPPGEARIQISGTANEMQRFNNAVLSDKVQTILINRLRMRNQWHRK